VGMILLGLANSLVWLFAARLFTGLATANIAVAQAYVADVTTPETRARGMGMIGMGFGLGFIFGPFMGGELGRFVVLGRPGAAAAFAAAALSVVNLVLALIFVPESLPPERRGPSVRRVIPVDPRAFLAAARVPGVLVALHVSFFAIFWFAGFEQTLRLYTEDGFHLTVADTGRLFALVGVVSVIVQGGLIHRLTRRFGEIRLLVAGTLFLGAGFALMAAASVTPTSPRTVLLFGMCVLAVGFGLTTPSLSSYVSRQAGREAQGLTLGVLQSVGALARVLGPTMGGLAYQFVGMRAPYWLGAIGMGGVALLAARLAPLPARGAQAEARAPATTSR
jgi:MFS transporter, DHA1 family, tetracycline resistance protein